jgi:hypothetical protein
MNLNYSLNDRNQYFSLDSYYAVKVQNDDDKTHLNVDDKDTVFKSTTLIFDIRKQKCYEIEVSISPVMSGLKPHLKEYFPYIY